MAVSTLVETVGGAESNTYATLVFAEQYFEDRVNASAWRNSVDDDKKNRCLLQAARDIDRCTFIGFKYNTSIDAEGNPKQAMEFPRDYTAATNGAYIPTEIKQAQCEQALYLFNLDTESQDAGDDQKIASFSRGGLSVTFRDSLTNNDPDRRGLKSTAAALIRPHLETSRGIKLIR